MVANIGLWDKKDPRFTVRGSYFVDDIDENDRDERITLTTGSHLVIYDEGISSYSGKLLRDQFELPLQTLDWVLMNIGRLSLPPNQGGYPDNRWSDGLYLSKDIDLGIMYAMNHHFGEYSFTIKNKAARSYTDDSAKQEIELFRKTLNEHGVLAKLVEINDLYKDGKL